MVLSEVQILLVIFVFFLTVLVMFVTQSWPIHVRLVLRTLCVSLILVVFV
jgi:hypothetical protein